MPIRSQLIRLAHSNPELRPHLLPLLKQANEITITTDSISDAVTSFLFKVAERDAQDVSLENGKVIMDFSVDDWNPEEPGEYVDIDYKVIIDLRRNVIQVGDHRGKKVYQKFPFNAWEANVSEVRRMLSKLQKFVPHPGFRFTEDTPSIQDNAPLEYFTER